MNSTPRHRFLSSEGAQALGQLTAELVRTWIVGLESCSAVNELFEALHSIFLGSLAQAAKDWNSAHDSLRILPLELRDMCFLSLPTVDKCQLGAVCSSWRVNSAKSPALWTKIDIIKREVDLRIILPRSGQLPLDINLANVSNSDSLVQVNAALRPHAHRLRRLYLRFSERYCNFFMPQSLRFFDYPAPLLEEFHLRNVALPGDFSHTWKIPSNLFNMHAPLLRTVVLRGIDFPSGGCAALAHVTHASIAARCSGLDHLFLTMPSLQWLELKDMFDYNIRPTVPAHSRLSEVVIRDFCLSYAELDNLGYTRLPRLTILSEDGISVVVDAAIHMTASSHSTLTIRPSGATELVLHRVDDSVAKFSAVNLDLKEASVALSFSTALRGVAHLVLPLHFDSTDWIYTSERRTAACPLLCPQLCISGGVDFPALRSMTICCAPCARRGCSLIDPRVARGVVRAPLLSRIEITADVWGTEVNVAHLTSFIDNNLVVDNRASLELSIAIADGIRLDYADSSDPNAVLNHLRSCVGTLLL